MREIPLIACARGSLPAAALFCSRKLRLQALILVPETVILLFHGLDLLMQYLELPIIGWFGRRPPIFVQAS